MKKNGPHYEPADCTGPNARSLREAEAAAKTAAEPITDREITSDLADLDDALATITDKRNKATAPKPAPDAENRTGWAGAGAARTSGGVYSVAWHDTKELEGEPPAHATVWNIGPNRPAVEVLEARAVADALERKLAWSRTEIERLTDQLKGVDQHSADALEIKREVLAALKELVPLAKRNAKRGSPGLLRLITRCIRTKL